MYMSKKTLKKSIFVPLSHALTSGYYCGTESTAYPAVVTVDSAYS